MYICAQVTYKLHYIITSIKKKMIEKRDIKSEGKKEAKMRMDW